MSSVVVEVAVNFNALLNRIYAIFPPWSRSARSGLNNNFSSEEFEMMLFSLGFCPYTEYPDKHGLD